MTRITTFAAALLTALMAVGLGATTAAQAAASTTITRPAPGSQVPTGTRTIQVRFGDDADAGDVRYAFVEVQNDAGTYDENGLDNDPYPYSGEVFTFEVPAMTEPGTYRATVFDNDGNEMASSTFDVVDVRVQVTNVSASPSPFYPLVRDGFRDSARVAYTLSERADTTVRVYRSADGKRVRTVNPRGVQGKGRHAWTWNGRTDAGSPVKPGRYRIEITADAADGLSSDTARTAVRATTDVVTRRATDAVHGNRTSSTSHRGNCNVTRLSYFGEVILDCWAGTYAQAVYTFRIPADATNLRWQVAGEVGCCDEGQLTRTGKRVAPRTFRVTVRVTNWRAYTVDRVKVSYAYRVTR